MTQRAGQGDGLQPGLELCVLGPLGSGPLLQSLLGLVERQAQRALEEENLSGKC